jgi:hypothetical protein
MQRASDGLPGDGLRQVVHAPQPAQQQCLCSFTPIMQTSASWHQSSIETCETRLPFHVGIKSGDAVAQVGAHCNTHANVLAECGSWKQRGRPLSIRDICCCILGACAGRCAAELVLGRGYVLAAGTQPSRVAVAAAAAPARAALR